MQWKTIYPNDVTIPGNNKKKRDNHAARSKFLSCKIFILKIVDRLLNKPKITPLHNNSNDKRISALSFEQHSGVFILILGLFYNFFVRFL